jgi:hypothetical protein
MDVVYPAGPHWGGVSSTASSTGGIPADLRDWHAALFAQGVAAGHLIETRPLVKGSPWPLRTFSSTLEAAARAALACDQAQHDTCAGLALRRKAPPGEKQHGRRQDCAATAVLWCEVDAKNSDLEACRRRLDTFGLPLSIVTFTGGGFHIKVLLDGLADLAQAGLLERVEAANSAHCAVPIGETGHEE